MQSRNTVKGAVGTKAQPLTTRFQFGPWTVTATKSHILESEGEARERFEQQLELPQLPEMIFANNVLCLQHDEGFGVKFNALDALKTVNAHTDPLKVAVSQAWLDARAGSEHIKEVVKPFDWTFTTNYQGTLLSSDEKQFTVEETKEEIDNERLKVREKIHFYEDIFLFEDELSDNGTSMLNVKIRVMPTSFFILMRQFMRVDNVIVKLVDTRFYHQAEQNYILRHFCCKEKKVDDIKAPLHILTDPNGVAPYLDTVQESNVKLVFPNTVATETS